MVAASDLSTPIGVCARDICRRGASFRHVLDCCLTSSLPRASANVKLDSPLKGFVSIGLETLAPSLGITYTRSGSYCLLGGLIFIELLSGLCDVLSRNMCSSQRAIEFLSKAAPSASIVSRGALRILCGVGILRACLDCRIQALNGPSSKQSDWVTQISSHDPLSIRRLGTIGAGWSISLVSEDVLKWEVRPNRECLSPKSVHGFRIATQLDPAGLACLQRSGL